MKAPSLEQRDTAARMMLVCKRCNVRAAVHLLGTKGFSSYAPHFCPHCGKPVEFDKEVRVWTSQTST